MQIGAGQRSHSTRHGSRLRPESAAVKIAKRSLVELGALTVRDARADLAGTIAELVAVADRHDLALLSAGTHPLSSWHDQTISPEPRYTALLHDMQWPARRLQIFGMHVHIGIRSGEKAIAIANALTRYLPIFLALSASSPYWEAHDLSLIHI